MNDTREELTQVPRLKKSWPKGVRGIGIEEASLLGVDDDGRLYWDGTPVAVSRKLTGWQTFGAFVVGSFVVIGSIGSFAQGWSTYHEWACDVGWPTVVCSASGDGGMQRRARDQVVFNRKAATLSPIVKANFLA